MALPESLTGDEVKEILQKRNATFIPWHNCSICDFEIGYVMEGEAVYFKLGCGCIDYGVLEPRTFDDIAGSYNMQDNDKARTEVLGRIKGETQ